MRLLELEFQGNSARAWLLASGAALPIGMKTTRVRVLSGEQLVFSNSDLPRSRLHNYKLLVERRVVLSFEVRFETPAERLGAIPAMIREAIEAEPLARFDRAHLMALAASSIDFEAVYFVLDADHTVHMDVKQRILLTLIRRFEAERIGFAYPTQTLYLQSPRADAPSAGGAS